MKIRKIILLLIISLISFQLCCGASGESSSSARRNEQKIVIYGDTRSDHLTHQKLVDAIVKIKPAAVFHTGDLVEDGLNPNHWGIFNGIVSELMKITKFYPALGNHEKNSQLFFDNFALPNNERWYSIEINDNHFILLDSNSDMANGSDQYRWLENDLQNISSTIKFVVAIFHHPPISTGLHGGDERGLRQTIVPLFEQYNVDLVFNGHDHDYERSLYHNIYFMVTGGGGAPLYDQTRTSPYSQLFIKTYHFCQLTIRDNQLILDVYNIDLNRIDQLQVDQKR